MPTTSLEDARSRMSKSVDSTRSEFSTVRTGRATPSLLDRISVDYYGTPTPLNQLAQIGAPEPRMLTVAPYDKGIFREIERAIAESDLGINPANDGQIIRLPIPQLTEDRRKDMVRVARNLAEDGRIAVRNVRRDAMNDLKQRQKAGEIGEDEQHRAEAELQKITDEYIAQIDAALKAKEAEIMEV